MKTNIHSGFTFAASLLVRLRAHVYSCLLLAKPRIVLLVAVTGASAMALEGSLAVDPGRFSAILAGIILAASAANAFNQYLDRDIDRLMPRTRNRRPIPAGKINPKTAVYVGFIFSGSATALLYCAGNGLTVLLGIGAIFIYVIVYTIWLKRRTAMNIVFGGASGAAAPLIGWSAGAGELGIIPFLMALVIFLWTPPHFWSLALSIKEEYAHAGIPMLPVISGEAATRVHITAYTLGLIPATAFLGVQADLGLFFLIGTTLLGLNFFRHLVALWYRKDRHSARKLFFFSIFYMAGVFILIIFST
ncbi:MAG: heme o synthase [Desulfobacterales bacterium]